jgi:hypothetical protein
MHPVFMYERCHQQELSLCLKKGLEFEVCGKALVQCGLFSVTAVCHMICIVIWSLVSVTDEML